jgi:hypothetical protein
MLWKGFYKGGRRRKKEKKENKEKIKGCGK